MNPAPAPIPTHYARRRGRHGPMGWLILALAMPLAVSGITACSTPAISDMVSRAGDTRNIKITDMRSVVRNGLLTAQVSIRNESETNPVGYRFKWLSKSGVAVWDEEAWKPITLANGQTTNLIGIAPTPDATDFRFELTQYR